MSSLTDIVIEEELARRDVLAGVHQAMCASGSTMVPGCLGIPLVFWWSADRFGLVIGMTIALIISLPVLRYLKRVDVHELESPTKTLAIANALPNTSWSLVPMLMMPDQPDHQYLVMALPFAFLAANLAAAGASRAVYLAGQIPVTVGAVIAFTVFADGNAKWVAAVVVATALALDGIAVGWGRAALEGAVLQRKNDRLVGELEAANTVLDHRSRHDYLTGLSNRRAFTDFLEAARADSDSSSQASQLGILLIDLDDFKTVNDQYGHRYGDDLLQQVAARLRSVVPESAELSRLGGDEFAAAWRDAPPLAELLETAAAINDKLRSAYSISGRRITISASVGIAVGDHVEGAGSEILQRADEALYAAKANGRDRAVAYERPSTPSYRPDAESRFDGATSFPSD